jgi:DNA-binding NarL/FixJ family response regulator
MRILIADDWPNVQDALRLLLEQQQGFEVVGEVVDATDLLAELEAGCPDLLLLGWELPGLVAARLLPALRRICPNLHVIALSGRAEKRVEAMSAGADAFVGKTEAPAHLLAAIAEVQRTLSQWPSGE